MNTEDKKVVLEEIAESAKNTSEPKPVTSPINPQEILESFPLVGGRSILVFIAIVAAFDYFCYRGSGALGYAILMGLTPVLLLLKSGEKKFSSIIIPSVFLLVLIAKTLWQYDSFTAPLGFVVLFFWAFRLSGHSACIIDGIISLIYNVISSPIKEIEIIISAFRQKHLKQFCKFNINSFIIPVVLLIVFTTVFSFANPIVNEWLSVAGRWFSDVFANFTTYLPKPVTFAFWGFSGLFAAVWLIPSICRAEGLKKILGSVEELQEEDFKNSNTDKTAFSAINSLVMLNVLFIAYCSIDFNYLWLRDKLPENISYSEYAINGTVWLTVALALTSLVLGAIFSGRLNFHKHTPLLRGLAWLWVALNALLAVFTYQRLVMYVNFNGLTRWRIVGAFGITLVVVGLSVVVWKIKARKSFLYMVRRQLRAFAIGLFILLIIPMDYLAHSFNVYQILNGNEGAAYQILTQQNSAEGLPVLLSLLKIEDEKLRNGTAAILLQELYTLKKFEKEHPRWTYYEISRSYALRELEGAEAAMREILPDWEFVETHKNREFRMERLFNSSRKGLAQESTSVKEMKKSLDNYVWPGRPAKNDVQSTLDVPSQKSAEDGKSEEAKSPVIP